MTREITKYIHQEQCRVALIEIAHLVNSNKPLDEMLSKICSTISSFLKLPWCISACLTLAVMVFTLIPAQVHVKK